MTEYESYHLLDSVSLQYGMLEKEQHKVLLDYMKAKFEVIYNNFNIVSSDYRRYVNVFFFPSAPPKSFFQISLSRPL